ncbi:unnamed protein product [Phytophthora fragariaefolia]|uniref:Unnamed protein product n=1 Tax=Phytophthora fragariaefolia TaxID=1490495 RepID=A0A9W6XVG2_9STRA|nr:unnamed protein product [Phytophthora fragariaefolia]
MLRTLSPTEQHGVALGFIMNEQREVAARATVSTPSTPRVASLKLHVNSYAGREGEPLLRWLVEVDTAITARRIVERVPAVEGCVRHVMSWRTSKGLGFLDLQQGKHDVHTYAQRARYLVSNIVTNTIDEATKVVTFMKGLSDGPVKTYLFRAYPSTLEAAITLAMQEGFSLRQAKLHANVPRQMPRPIVKPTGGPEPMDLSSVAATGSQQRRGSTNDHCFRWGNYGHYARECTASVPVAKGRRDDKGIATDNKKTKTTSRPPAGDAVERVDIGHAVPRAAAHSECPSHCKKQDGKPNLVILKVNSTRERSHHALVDCGASNNFVRLQSLARLGFAEIELPRCRFEVRLATGVVVRTKKRIVRVRFSHRDMKFVDKFIVLDLDDKFDSDGLVGAAHARRGACDPPTDAEQAAATSDLSARALATESATKERCEPNQKPQIRSDLRDLQSAKRDAVESTVIDTQVEHEVPVTEGSELDASAPGSDAIGPNINGHSRIRRRGNRSVSAPGADAASRAGGCKRSARKMLACVQPGFTTKQYAIKSVLIGCGRGLIPPAPKERLVHGRAGIRQYAPNLVPHQKRTAQARQAAQVSVRGRDVARSVCRADTATGDNRRDPEWLDAYGYCSSVLEAGAGEPSDASPHFQL